MSFQTLTKVVTLHFKLRVGSMNLENMTTRWIFGEEKISNSRSESGNVGEKWKLFPVQE